MLVVSGAPQRPQLADKLLLVAPELARLADGQARAAPDQSGRALVHDHLCKVVVAIERLPPWQRKELRASRLLEHEVTSGFQLQPHRTGSQVGEMLGVSP
eukprot:2770879-Lingulodinium_polyedra.AAC.1